MCIRKGYILALGYERGGIWVKKTGILKSAVHGEAHARAERLKNKLYGSTVYSN